MIIIQHTIGTNFLLWPDVGEGTTGVAVTSEGIFAGSVNSISAAYARELSKALSLAADMLEQKIVIETPK